MEAFDIIILALFAGFILLRLRSELGNTSEEDHMPPPNSMDRRGQTVDVEVGDAPEEKVIPFEENPSLRHAYQQIHAADRSFDAATFLDGAANAYQMILKAFWDGDKAVLKDFLSDTVFNQFAGAVDARDEAGHKMENRIVDLEDVKVVSADLQDKIAEITISFKSEIIALTKDGEGHVIAGNPSDVVEVNDIWTFARDVRSKDPSWALVATKAG